MSNSSNNQTNNTDDQDDRPALTPSISYVKRLEEENQRLKQQQQQQQQQPQQQEPAQQEQTQNDGQCGADNTCALFLSSSLGWTPELYNKIKKVKCGESTCIEWSQAIFYSFAFLVDLADAIFDLILAFQTLYAGSTGEKGLGILLGVMTILGRFTTGLYGRFAMKIMQKDDRELFKAFFYLFMELSVFMLEDGAAILLLAKTTTNSSSLDILQTISLCLTLICAGSILLVLIGFMVIGISYGIDYNCENSLGLSIFLPVIVFPIFMIWILIQEVLMKGEDDPPFSGRLELASYIIYGIGAFIIGLFSNAAFVVSED